MSIPTRMVWKRIALPFMQRVWRDAGLEAFLEPLTGEPRQQLVGQVKDINVSISVGLQGGAQALDSSVVLLLSQVRRSRTVMVGWNLEIDGTARTWVANHRRADSLSDDPVEIEAVMIDLVSVWPRTPDARQALFRSPPRMAVSSS